MFTGRRRRRRLRPGIGLKNRTGGCELSRSGSPSLTQQHTCWTSRDIRRPLELLAKYTLEAMALRADTRAIRLRPRRCLFPIHFHRLEAACTKQAILAAAGLLEISTSSAVLTSSSKSGVSESSQLR